MRTLRCVVPEMNSRRYSLLRCRSPAVFGFGAQFELRSLPRWFDKLWWETFLNRPLLIANLLHKFVCKKWPSWLLIKINTNSAPCSKSTCLYVSLWKSEVSRIILQKEFVLVLVNRKWLFCCFKRRMTALALFLCHLFLRDFTTRYLFRLLVWQSQGVRWAYVYELFSQIYFVAL